MAILDEICENHEVPYTVLPPSAQDNPSQDVSAKFRVYNKLMSRCETFVTKNTSLQSCGLRGIQLSEKYK
jgi:hypothetical protein